jgi:uncharacterized protein YdeI (YjbR/CyaY-like superfamily)
VRKTVDEVSYTMRFAPRRPDSVWSLVNIERAAELERQSLMHPAGLAAYRKRDEKRAREHSATRRTSRFDAASERRFRANKRAWTFFEAQPPGYRRIATWWVTSAKREETRLRRLAALIDVSANGRRLDMLSPGPSRSSPS